MDLTLTTKNGNQDKQQRQIVANMRLLIQTPLKPAGVVRHAQHDAYANTPTMGQHTTERKVSCIQTCTLWDEFVIIIGATGEITITLIYNDTHMYDIHVPESGKLPALCPCPGNMPTCLCTKVMRLNSRLLNIIRGK